MNDGPNDKTPVGKTATDILNQQATRIQELETENGRLAEHKRRLDEMDAWQTRLVQECETSEVADLKVRAQDLHRIAYLIHHAVRIELAGGTVVEGDGLLNLREALDHERVARKDAKPLRTVRTVG